METISRISRELPSGDGQSLTRLRTEADRLRACGRVIDLVHDTADAAFRLTGRLPCAAPTLS